MSTPNQPLPRLRLALWVMLHPVAVADNIAYIQRCLWPSSATYTCTQAENMAMGAANAVLFGVAKRFASVWSWPADGRKDDDVPGGWGDMMWAGWVHDCQTCGGDAWVKADAHVAHAVVPCPACLARATETAKRRREALASQPDDDIPF